MPSKSLILLILIGVFGGAPVGLSAAAMPPVATATFSQTTIALNAMVTLTITITNPAGNPVPLTGIGFTDTLPAGLRVGAGGVSGTCNSGTASAVEGTAVITVSGVSLALGASCVLSINIVGVTLGAWSSSFVVNSAEGGSSSSVFAGLVVSTLAAPVVSAAFVPATVPQNGSTRLMVSITNPNAQAYSFVATLETLLPDGLFFSVPANASSSCGGQLTVGAGGPILAFQTTNFPANTTCILSANVTATVPGTYTYSAVFGAGGTGASNTASAILTVTSTTTPGSQNFQEIAMFRIQNGQGLFVFDVNRNYKWDAADKVHFFGQPGDIPVAGDWFGTGVISIGVFHCAPGATLCQWMIDANNNGTWDGVAGGDALWNFGIPGDIPVVGDWTGDAISKIGIMRCNADPCVWVLDAGNRHVFDASARFARFGVAGDIPVVNDWAGTGGADQIGVFRRGQWIVDINGNGTFDPGDAIYLYGTSGDMPIVGNWYGTGKRRIGVVRPGFDPIFGSGVLLNISGNNTWIGPPSDGIGYFGAPGDLPVIGFWTLP